MQAFFHAPAEAHLRFHDLPGPGRPILFVHGLGCASSCDFPRVARALAGRRSLLVDLLGFGFSDRPEGFGYAVEDHAESLCALLAALSLTELDLFGHSMGGAVAIEAARRSSARVRHLILAEPNLDAGGGFFSRPVAEREEGDYVARGHEAAVRAAVSDGNLAWAGSLRVSSPLAVHRGARSLVRGGVPSWREQLAELGMPRTVLFGARSLPDPDTDRLGEIGATVRVVPDAGHSMATENSSGLAEAIRLACA